MPGSQPCVFHSKDGGCLSCRPCGVQLGTGAHLHGAVGESIQFRLKIVGDLKKILPARLIVQPLVAPDCEILRVMLIAGRLFQVNVATVPIQMLTAMEQFVCGVTVRVNEGQLRIHMYHSSLSCFDSKNK